MSKYSHNREEMDTPQYKAWRFAVLSRDGWICAKCKTKGKELNVHHIIRWTDSPRLRYVQSNGITLCKDCHETVTGREEIYEEEFKRIVAQHKFLKQGEHTKAYSKYKPKYRPRNPYLRF